MNRNLELLDPVIMGNEDSMYNLLNHLREHDPVTYVDHPKYEPFWALTRHQDIKFVSQNNSRFINNPRTLLVQKQFEQALLDKFGTRNGLETLIHMDAPKHKTLRAVTRDWFKPGPIGKRSSSLELIAKQYVDKMEALGGECDFVKEISLLYPLQAIMAIIGVPPEEEAMMLKLTQELFGGADPTQARGADEQDAMAVIMDFFAYFTKLVEDRKKNPKDDLATVLATAVVNGEPMEQLDQISYFIIAATAGHDTTAATIAGGLKALIENPEQLQKLRDNPELCNSAAREMIRYTAPVRHMMRTTTQDETFQGQTIKAGESICLWYPAANRDNDAINNPDVFDIERDNKNQLAFGSGSHMCLGQHLAVLEVELFFRELLPRIKNIEMIGDIEWLKTNFVGGPKSMPVRYQF